MQTRADTLNSERVYSAVLDCANTMPVQMFHLLLEYGVGVYYLPKCGALIVAEQDGETLFLADVVASAPISFDELKSELPFCGVKYVEFGFCPDWLDVNPIWKPVDGDKEPFFLKGSWDLPKAYRFSAMSTT